MRKLLLFAAAVATLIAMPLFAQMDHSMGAAPAKKVAASTKKSAAPAPVTLNPALGPMHHPVTTSNPEAQKFFDQGLNLVYGFNHNEAEKSFQRAAQLDPKMEMAYWGIAYAVGPNYNQPVDWTREEIAYE